MAQTLTIDRLPEVIANGSQDEVITFLWRSLVFDPPAARPSSGDIADWESRLKARGGGFVPLAWMCGRYCPK